MFQSRPCPRSHGRSRPSQHCGQKAWPTGLAEKARSRVRGRDPDPSRTFGEGGAVTHTPRTHNSARSTSYCRIRGKPCKVHVSRGTTTGKDVAQTIWDWSCCKRKWRAAAPGEKDVAQTIREVSGGSCKWKWWAAPPKEDDAAQTIWSWTRSPCCCCKRKWWAAASGEEDVAQTIWESSGGSCKRRWWATAHIEKDAAQTIWARSWGSIAWIWWATPCG